MTGTADWLAAMRRAYPDLSLITLEVLVRVAEAGEITRSQLAEAMPGVAQSTITRSVNALRGRARFRAGRWQESPVRLLQERPDPHRPNRLLLSLSPDGREATDLLFS